MDYRICYFNGKYIRENEAKVHISDWGLWEGSVYEVVRTYNGIPFRLKEHVDRFFASLHCLPFIRFKMTPEQVCDCVLKVIKRNQTSLPAGDEWHITFRASRGVWTPDMLTEPTFYIYIEPYGCYKSPHPCEYETMSKLYKEGAYVVAVNTRRIPPECLDPKIKSSNRLGNSMAKYEANLVDPAAFPLMLDIHGFVSESAIENFLIVKDGKVFTSRITNCLSGITRQTVLELCHKIHIESIETDLNIYHLFNADEMMLTNTNYAIIPVSKVNGSLLKIQVPGPITKKIQAAFSKLVDYDIVQRVGDYIKNRAR
jgi:branched-chain amino acid aminotransferase